MLCIAAAAVAAVRPITWKETSLNIGTVQTNTSVPIAFEFTNTGDTDVTILEAKGSCGCTEVAYPKTSIAPGESASITASFRSGKEGTFQKNIKIKTSASADYTYLYFSGESVNPSR